MSGIDFAALRKQISITDVLKLLGFQPTSQAGARLRGFCPLHRGDDPRDFVVDIGDNHFYCHGCHKGGNQLDLWCKARKLPIHPAAKDLCTRLNLPIPEIHRW